MAHDLMQALSEYYVYIIIFGTEPTLLHHYINMLKYNYIILLFYKEQYNIMYMK
jgi:hypothetical protein